MKKHSFRFVAKMLSVAAVGALGILSSSPAHAGSASASMSLSADVSANCTISAGALAFGAYDPVSANAASPLDGSAQLTVQCTMDASASIQLGQGDNADAGSSDAAPLRRLSDGAGHSRPISSAKPAGHDGLGRRAVRLA